MDVTLTVQRKYNISDACRICPRAYNQLMSYNHLKSVQEAAEAERDWQERVREGRFVVLRVKPSLDLHTVEHLMSISRSAELVGTPHGIAHVKAKISDEMVPCV